MAATAENLNQSRRMNLSTLKQRDPFITAIVDTASQVALYSFSSKANEWVSWIRGSVGKRNPGLCQSVSVSDSVLHGHRIELGSVTSFGKTTTTEVGHTLASGCQSSRMYGVTRCESDLST